jgi:hypothetical protein
MPHVECAGPLIETKDKLHRRWFELQSFPQNVESEGTTLLDRRLLDIIVEESQKAVDYAKGCEADPEHIAMASGLITRLKDKIDFSDKTRYAGRVYYRMLPTMATSILISDINKLINSIHEMGRAFVDIEGRFGGCALERQDDTRELNRATLAYCEGVASSGTLRKSGTVVEHKLGAHHNVLEVDEQEDGYNAQIEYTESGASNWDSRQQGVMNHLKEKWGIECEAQGLSAKCRGKVKTPLEFTEIAYFLSSIRDVDLLNYNCVLEAIEWAESEASNTVEELKGKSYTRKPYPNDSDDWRTTICPYDEERERRRRREDRLQELDSNASYWTSKGTSAVDKLAGEPCKIDVYGLANEAITARENLKSVCREIREVGGSSLDCDYDKNILEERSKEAFKTLLERCPTAPIIKVLESKYTGYELAYNMHELENVCEDIGDEDCLREVNEAIARDKAGVKPLTLPLEV